MSLFSRQTFRATLRRAAVPVALATASVLVAPTAAQAYTKATTIVGGCEFAFTRELNVSGTGIFAGATSVGSPSGWEVQPYTYDCPVEHWDTGWTRYYGFERYTADLINPEVTLDFGSGPKVYRLYQLWMGRSKEQGGGGGMLGTRSWQKAVPAHF